MAKSKSTLEFDEVYEYIKNELLKYPPEMKLNRYTIGRIRGLNKGTFIKGDRVATYEYPVILLTFKYCRSKIIKAFENIEFSDEKHKINYMFVIVESELNNIQLKLNNKAKVEQKEDVKVNTLSEQINSNKAKYKPNRRVNNNLKGMLFDDNEE